MECDAAPPESSIAHLDRRGRATKDRGILPSFVPLVEQYVASTGSLAQHFTWGSGVAPEGVSE
jgi:hypothetical protein